MFSLWEFVGVTVEATHLAVLTAKDEKKGATLLITLFRYFDVLLAPTGALVLMMC